MPILPVEEVTYPAVLKGQSNGRLPSPLLHAVKMPGGGRDALLVEPAARCFRAMVAAAADDGLLLMCTEGFRTYERQVALHLDRYYVVNFKTDRYWDGRYWLKRPGVAVAAKPGTSNHGWGLAADLAEQLDADPQPESISDRAVAWLIANAARFGISAEIQSEPWHWRMYTGDNIPAAVLAYEQSIVEDEMKLTLFQEKDGPAVYLGNGLEYKWVKNEGELANIRYLASIGKIGPLTDGGKIMTGVAYLDSFGVLIGPDPHAPNLPPAQQLDVQKLAELLADEVREAAREGAKAGAPTREELVDAAREGAEIASDS